MLCMYTLAPRPGVPVLRERAFSGVRLGCGWPCTGLRFSWLHVLLLLVGCCPRPLGCVPLKFRELSRRSHAVDAQEVARA